jgi:hypothetical protein
MGVCGLGGGWFGGKWIYLRHGELGVGSSHARFRVKNGQHGEDRRWCLVRKSNVLLYFVDVVEGFHCQTRKLVRSIANGLDYSRYVVDSEDAKLKTLLQIKLKMLEGALSRMILFMVALILSV